MQKPDDSPQPSRHASGNAVVRLCGKDFYLGPYGSPEPSATRKGVANRHPIDEPAAARQARRVPHYRRLAGHALAWLQRRLHSHLALLAGFRRNGTDKE